MRSSVERWGEDGAAMEMGDVRGLVATKALVWQGAPMAANVASTAIQR